MRFLEYLIPVLQAVQFMYLLRYWRSERYKRVHPYKPLVYKECVSGTMGRKPRIRPSGWRGSAACLIRLVSYMTYPNGQLQQILGGFMDIQGFDLYPGGSRLQMGEEFHELRFA